MNAPEIPVIFDPGDPFAHPFCEVNELELMIGLRQRIRPSREVSFLRDPEAVLCSGHKIAVLPISESVGVCLTGTQTAGHLIELGQSVSSVNRTIAIDGGALTTSFKMEIAAMMSAYAPDLAAQLAEIFQNNSATSFSDALLLCCESLGYPVDAEAFRRNIIEGDIRFLRAG